MGFCPLGCAAPSLHFSEFWFLILQKVRAEMEDLRSPLAQTSDSLSLLMGNNQPVTLPSSHSLQSRSGTVTWKQSLPLHQSFDLPFCDRPSLLLGVHVSCHLCALLLCSGFCESSLLSMAIVTAFHPYKNDVINLEHCMYPGAIYVFYLKLHMLVFCQFVLRSIL